MQQLEKVIIKDRRSFSIKDKLKESGAIWDAAAKVWFFPYSDMYGAHKGTAQKYILELKRAGFNLELVYSKVNLDDTFSFDNYGGANETNK